MKDLASRLVRALINRETITIFGCNFEVTDFRAEVLTNNEIDGEIILLDKDSNNYNRITVDILIKGNEDEPSRNGTDGAKDA